MSRADVVTIADLLQRGKGRPEDVFPFFRYHPDEIDVAEVLEFHPGDDLPDVAAEDRRVRRTCTVGSCSAETLDRWEKGSSAVQTYVQMMALERAREQEAALDGEPYTRHVIPKPAEAEGAYLQILLARMVAEGLRDWLPAPKAVVAIPSAEIKRGEDLPVLDRWLPADPMRYDAKDHKILLAVVGAIPSRLFQMLCLGVAWVSNLDVMRFFPDEDAEKRQDGEEAPPEGKDAGKPSGPPSAGPSSEPGTESGRDDEAGSGTSPAPEN